MSSAPRRGLGRGLEVLVGGAGASELVHLPLEMIHANPRQPRKAFDGDAAAGLAASVRAQGLLQPLLVRARKDGGYELIAGERRLRAAREARLATVPAVIREADDRESVVLGLVENVAREQLSPLEESRAYAVLLDEFGLALGEIADRVGRSKPSVSNRLRLLELPDEVLEMLSAGALSEGHARAILALPDNEARKALAHRAVKSGMSVRQVEQATRDAGAPRQRRSRPVPLDPDLASRATRAAERLTGFHARVSPVKLEIRFAGETELAELVEALERTAEPQHSTST
ncbi:MAG: ParB/RepB/Spo0J family partition protein [Gaiellaceae bacterium]